ncbi:PEP-CTERM sorting domain-containing protein [Rubritalea sp.]|uniref:PEP-CTERM sorting domain-containing protein n=1 Tax=Rubritalea sp. TaxID=2109375 RepID=UPI003EF11C54
MKTSIKLIIFLGFTQIASATTVSITVDNFNDGFNQVTNSSGTALTQSTSSFYLGVMNESVIGTSNSVTDLFAGFTAFDTPIQLTDPGDSDIFVSPGFFSGLAVDFDTSAYDNESVYVFAMNGTSAGSSTEAFIWKAAGITFNNTGDPFTSGVDGGATAQSFSMTSANGSLIFGSETTAGNPFATADVSAVPEPSSTALLGLGSVALLLRRRR